MLKNKELVTIHERNQQQNGKTAQWEFSRGVLVSKYHEDHGNKDEVMGRYCDRQRSKVEFIQDFCQISWRKQLDEDAQIILKRKQRGLRTSAGKKGIGSVWLLSTFGFHELLQFLDKPKNNYHINKESSPWLTFVISSEVSLIQLLLLRFS